MAGTEPRPGAAPVARVLATPAALELIERLPAKHGDLVFHQSGGCCDGSAPMCFPRGDLAVGEGDVLLGEIGGAPPSSRRAACRPAPEPDASDRRAGARSTSPA